MPRRPCRRLLILLAPALFSACGNVFNIDYDGGGADGSLLVNARQVYELQSDYDKAADLSVMLVSPKGTVSVPPVSDLRVFYGATRVDDRAPAYKFLVPGKFTFSVYYGNISADYTLYVLDGGGSGGGVSGGGSSGGGSGIGWIWATP